MKNNGQIFDDLYTITGWNDDDEGSFTVSVRFNRNHRIYSVHFPGNPITPGACILQAATELLSQHLGREMTITKARNIKFINLIHPSDDNIVDFIFRVSANDDGTYNASVNVCNDSVTYVKISATYAENKDGKQ